MPIGSFVRGLFAPNPAGAAAGIPTRAERWGLLAAGLADLSGHGDGKRLLSARAALAARQAAEDRKRRLAGQIPGLPGARPDPFVIRPPDPSEGLGPPPTRRGRIV